MTALMIDKLVFYAWTMFIDIKSEYPQYAYYIPNIDKIKSPLYKPNWNVLKNIF